MYKLSITSYADNALAAISAALGFKETLSHGAIVDIFAKDIPHKSGVFRNREQAQTVADAMNKRGAFGGFGPHAVTACVQAA